MPRTIRFALAAAVVAAVPIGVSSAQTTTSSTTATTAVTTTTLPICFPGNPTHQLGVTCQLPGIECNPPSPHPACGNFPAQPEDVRGESQVLTAPAPPTGPTGPTAPPPRRRISLTG